MCAVHKNRVLGIILVFLLNFTIFAGGVSAQDAARGSAQVRIIQLFYRSMDLFADGEIAVPKLGFTFDTDYLPFTAGQHSLAVASAGKGIETGIASAVNFAAGHLYSVVVYGNWDSDKQPTLLVLDETEQFAGMDPANNRVLILHLVSGAPAVDGYVDDALVKEELAYGQAAVFEVPPGPFTTKITVAGQPEMTLQNYGFFSGIPQGVTIAALIGTSPLSAFIVYQTNTTLTLADYLTFERENEGGFQQIGALIETAGLTGELDGEGPFTLFAPLDSAIEALPQATRDTLQADPAALADVLRYHLVAEHLPPYVLDGQFFLTSLQGSALMLDYPTDDWWHVNGVPIYQAIRVGNGIFYPIGGVLNPAGGRFQPEEASPATS